jgi:hypothetical protein
VGASSGKSGFGAWAVALGLAVVATSGCGHPRNEDILGSCAADSGPPRQVRLCDPLYTRCFCGSGAKCTDAGTCVSCDCAAEEYCESDGECTHVPWYGQLPSIGPP